LKIIDEKGRLFGKINIIDFFVILVLISFTTVLYYGYKITFDKRETVKDSWIGVTVKFLNVMPELANALKVGDDEHGPSGYTIGKITEIIDIYSSESIILTDMPTITRAAHLVEHPYKKTVLLKLEVLQTGRNGALYYKDTPIKIGNKIVFSTKYYNIDGRIVGIEEK